METLNIILLIITIAYGIAFGIKNWINRILSILTSKTLIQNELGTLLDFTWLTIVGYLIYNY